MTPENELELADLNRELDQMYLDEGFHKNERGEYVPHAISVSPRDMDGVMAKILAALRL